jgi:hypothetical protein
VIEKMVITMTGEIENLIDEFPQASNRRVEEIATRLEGVLSDIECKFPTEDDTDSAYECQNIPKAKELIVRVRAWNENDGELKTGDRKSENRESGVINGLSKELKTTFNQICRVSTDLG